MGSKETPPSSYRTQFFAAYQRWNMQLELLRANPESLNRKIVRTHLLIITETLIRAYQKLVTERFLIERFPQRWSLIVFSIQSILFPNRIRKTRSTILLKLGNHEDDVLRMYRLLKSQLKKTDDRTTNSADILSSLSAFEIIMSREHTILLHDLKFFNTKP